MSYTTVNLVGGAAFAVWGLIHVGVAGLGLWHFYTGGTEAILEFVDLDAAANEQATRMGHLVAEFYQALLLIGLTVTILSGTLSLDGHPLALLLNAILVVSIEAYFVWYEVRPGHRPTIAAIVSIVLLVIGITFGWLGLQPGVL